MHIARAHKHKYTHIHIFTHTHGNFQQDYIPDILKTQFDCHPCDRRQQMEICQLVSLSLFNGCHLHTYRHSTTTVYFICHPASHFFGSWWIVDDKIYNMITMVRRHGNEIIYKTVSSFILIRKRERIFLTYFRGTELVSDTT